MDLELLFKVASCWDGENASVCFLTEHVFGPLGGMTAFKEYEGPENSLLFVVELLWSQADVEGAGVQEYMAVVELLWNQADVEGAGVQEYMAVVMFFTEV